jgi:hypothetical protein
LTCSGWWARVSAPSSLACICEFSSWWCAISEAAYCGSSC